MVLQTQSPASHNQMLGQRIRHPSSTKYNEEFETPTAKRLKRLDSTDSSISRRDDSEAEEEDAQIPTPQGPSRCTAREIPDSEAESDDGDDLVAGTSRKTDLESALPPVRTDKEAIAEYEATRAAEAVDLDLQERLGQRKWVQGKSSIYVDAFNLALETVLEDESHLFDEAEMAVFDQWRGLSYEGQYL
jgi:Fanconi-associated nuclease 1